MIRCNRNVNCNECVVDLNPIHVVSGVVTCDIAKSLGYCRQDILAKCKYAEPTNIHDEAIKELFS